MVELEPDNLAQRSTTELRLLLDQGHWSPRLELIHGGRAIREAGCEIGRLVETDCTDPARVTAFLT